MQTVIHQIRILCDNITFFILGIGLKKQLRYFCVWQTGTNWYVLYICEQIV